MSPLTRFFYLWNFLFMVEEKIRDTLSLRLKKLGYHLIRVKLININKKKNIADYGREN